MRKFFPRYNLLIAENAVNQHTLSKSEQNKICNNTNEKLLSDFTAEKEKLANKVLTNENISVDMNEQTDGSLYGEKKIDLGDGCYINVICKDEAEISSIKYLSNTISSLFTINALAGEKKNTVTKNFGDRMYSVSFVIYIGGGTANVELENHYKLSSNGITERYGASSSSAVGIGVNITEHEPVITDRYATIPGRSNTNMYCKYSYSSSISSVNLNGERTINSILTYKSINKGKETITLEEKSTI